MALIAQAFVTLELLYAAIGLSDLGGKTGGIQGVMWWTWVVVALLGWADFFVHKGHANESFRPTS